MTFGPFRLDLEGERLWHGDEERPLRAKSFSVLRELLRKRGRLVTKQDLFRACWPDTAVSQTVLRVCIGEIRAALGDDGMHPALLETVGRRGYRLVAGADAAASTIDALLGRDRELARLRRALARADSGLRQLVFVTGEPGLGKTTLLDHFVERIRATTRARVAFGQCVELVGGTEAYLPILDLLGRLCAEDDDRQVLAAFERWAPSWLLQMPGLIDASQAEALRRRVPSPTRERMLRELGETLEALSVERPLVLVLEDLHWSDTSSVDALAYLAQRTSPARLLMIGSYRALDLALANHPLKAMKQSLQARARCTDIPLELLAPADTDAYLRHRLPEHPIDPALGGEIHRRTDGNPLFMRAMVDDLLEREILRVSADCWHLSTGLDGLVPESVRQLAQHQLDRLAPRERLVLEAASAVGVEFAVAAVAAAIDTLPEDVEHVCATLAVRNQLVAATGVAVWPDGTVSGTYEFQHSIYRDVLDRALSPARRRELHRKLGERVERGHQGDTRRVATVLAFHFDHAGDHPRAVRYHVEAAAAAKERFADREVILHLQAALERLPRLPETVERAQTELGCLLDLGGALFAAHGCASDDAMAVHGRALEVADRLELPQARIQAHSARYTFHVMRAELPHALAIAEDLLATAARLPVPFFVLLGHMMVGGVRFNLGDLAAARAHLERAHSVWQPGFPSLPLDPTLLYRTMLGFTVLLEGRPAEGAHWIRSSLAHAEAMNHPYTLSYARELAAQYHATAGDRDLALEHAAAALAVATEHGFPIHAAVAGVVRGWGLRDVSAVRESLGEYEGRGQYLATSLFRALLVEAELEQGLVDAALEDLKETFAFVERSGERRHLAELYRLQGECLLRRSGFDATRGRQRMKATPSYEEAEAYLERALALARQQGARFWELRAALSLANVWAAEGREAEAQALLDDVCRSFPEGCDLPDLDRARQRRARL